MHLRLTSFLSLVAISAVTAVQADPIDIPDKARETILKRHPGAYEMEAANETHFGQKLYEISFKDDSGKVSSELFTMTGHLFTGEVKLIGLSGVSPAAVETLDKTFPKYTLQKTELIVNPNGVGEEYEIYLHADGSDWKVVINHRGVVNEKERLNP